MVASIIASFIALTAVAALRTVTAGRDKINQNIDAAAEIRYTAALLRKDLGNLYRDRNFQNIKFVGISENTDYGPSTKITFYATNTIKARPEKPEGDVYEVEYFLRREEDQALLIRRLWPNPGKEFAPGGIATILARNIIAFETKYYDGTQWAEEWPEEMSTLPQLASVTLVARMPEQKGFIKHTFMVNYSRWPRQQDRNAESNNADDRAPKDENQKR